MYLWLGEMKNTTFSKNYSAAAEVVGAIILVLIAMGAFAAIYLQVLPVKFPSPEPHVQLAGYVADDGKVVLEHVGGEVLNSYEVHVTQSDGPHTYDVENNPWEIGECYYPPVNITLFNQEKQVQVSVYGILQDGSTKCVFDGIITPKDHPSGPTAQPLPDPMSISTLRTDTVDEDLICYSYSIHPNIIPITYIYNWMVAITGPYQSLTRLLFSFDSQNPFQTKDYSSHYYNGTITGATWTTLGKLGGAYHYDGDDFITIPYCFETNKINKITIEAWIKTNQTSGTIVSYNRSNYYELAITNGHLKWSTNATDGIVDVTGTISVNDNLWHLIAVTYNASSGICSLYVDGRLDLTRQAHLTNKPLGSGNSQAGVIGKGAGVTGRKTIFSSDFESRDETSKWTEDHASAQPINDAVDNNICNVDASVDKGTETGFSNAQGIAPDGNSMTIQEADQDAGTSTLGKTTGIGTSYTSISANQMAGQAFTATSSGEIYQATFYGRSSSGTINAKIVLCDSTGHILTNGISSTISVSSTAGNKVGTWSAGSRPIVQNGQTYWIMVLAQTSSVRLYYDATTGGTSKIDTSNSYSSPSNPTDATSGTTNYRGLYADINNFNYQIDFEYQWTAAVYSLVNEQVCIYTTTHTGTENLNVNYWAGSAWSTLGTIAATGWSNFTATGLTSATYTLQLKGATETNDAAQDQWTVDAIFLHLWATQGVFDNLPATVLTPNSGSFSLGGSSNTYPLYTMYNRTTINLTGYKDIRLSVWYSYKNTESNDFFGLYYKNNSIWVPIFEIPNPTQSGQKPWTQVIVTIPQSLKQLQIQFKWRTTSSSEYVAIDDLNITGMPENAENNFIGSIDEVKIYPRILTLEQLYQNYLCTKDGSTSKTVIVSEELRVDDSWKCLVTPNDGLHDDLVTESNIINIINYNGGG